MTLISLEDAKAEVRKVVSDFKTRYDINYRLNSLPSIEIDEAEQTEPMIYPQVDGITPSVIQKVGYATDSVTGEILGMTLDTDCSWK